MVAVAGLGRRLVSLGWVAAAVSGLLRPGERQAMSAINEERKHRQCETRRSSDEALEVVIRNTIAEAALNMVRQRGGLGGHTDSNRPDGIAAAAVRHSRRHYSLDIRT